MVRLAVHNCTCLGEMIWQNRMCCDTRRLCCETLGKKLMAKAALGKAFKYKIQNTNQLNTKYNIRNTNTIYENTSKIKIQSTLRKKLMAKAVLGKAFKATGVSVGCGTAEITTSMIFLPAEY